MTLTLPLLTPIEARILGVLVEKEKTVPDTYPLTLNSLVAGCNQKTSRDPVMNLHESELQAALEELRSRSLVLETYGASGRVLRYAHNFGKCYGVPAGSVALLAVLMLRGAQTVSELRANCERLYRFDDASSVEGYLEELATRAAGALVLRLPKQPGVTATAGRRWRSREIIIRAKGCCCPGLLSARTTPSVRRARAARERSATPFTRVRIPPKAPMKQTRGRGIDNPGGAFADDGEPTRRGSVHIREPYTGIPASQRRR